MMYSNIKFKGSGRYAVSIVLIRYVDDTSNVINSIMSNLIVVSRAVKEEELVEAGKKWADKEYSDHDIFCISAVKI